MSDFFKYFRSSLFVTILGLFLAYFLGGLEAMLMVVILSILEISLSFDNAVVNATVLKDMNEIWRRRFLTWGILIAVFGMRIIFPVIIVSVVAGLSPIESMSIAIGKPDVYAEYLSLSNISIMAFGGAFLMMVGFNFFFDTEKDHWFSFIEKPLSNMAAESPFIPYALTAFFILVVPSLMSLSDSITFFFSGLSGVLLFAGISKLTDYMEKKEQKRALHSIAKGGAAMFFYLEVIDASFSFDGVIGAFAITTNIFIIAIGLGIGAMFVRSMTIVLVEKNTLEEYVYLEHGAFYAITILSVIMIVKTFIHVPELITGLVGAIFIIASFIHSLVEKNRINTSYI